MPDNLQLNLGAGGSILAGASIAFSGDTSLFQICAGTILTGAEGTWAQTLIVGGAGVVGAGVQRVTLASDDPAVAKLVTIEVDTGNIATSVASVDGKVTACNTGAVTVAASALPTGAATEATLAAIAGYLDTETAAMVTSVQLLDNAISGNEMQVDVITSALPTGAATAALQTSGNASLTSIDGKVTACNTGAVVVASGAITETNSGNIKTAVEKIDDAISGSEMQVDVVAALPAGTNMLGSIIAQQSSSIVYDGATACTVKDFMVVGTTAGNNELVAAVGGKKIRLLHLEIIALSATANTVYLVNGDFNLIANVTNQIPIAVDADGNYHGGFVTGPGWQRQTDTVNEAVMAVQTATAPILYMGTYIEVA